MHCRGHIRATPHNGARRFGQCFDPSESMENAGILDVFPIFHAARLGAKDPPKPAAPIVRCCLSIFRKNFSPVEDALFPEGRSDLFLLLPIKNRRAASPKRAAVFGAGKNIQKVFVSYHTPLWGGSPLGGCFLQKALRPEGFLWALTDSPQRAWRQCSRRSRRGPGTGRGRRRGNRSRRRTGRPDCLRRTDPERGCRPHGPPWSWHR